VFVFMAVFGFVNAIALCWHDSMWVHYPTNAYDLTAPVVATIGTILIVLKMDEGQVRAEGYNVNNYL